MIVLEPDRLISMDPKEARDLGLAMLQGAATVDVMKELTEAFEKKQRKTSSEGAESE